MYQIDFNKPCNVHFIGIGGISMSGLAKLLAVKGFKVSGSDSRKSDLTMELEAAGCHIYYEQAASNITPDIDLVVYTAAIHENNPELMAARASKANVISRAELLGQVMLNYKTAINVAGTHGKTTTSSMISMILMNAAKDPTISLGGMLDAIGGNFRIGSSDVFIAEACEYTNSFLSFNPTISIILNVRADHLDFFKDIDDIRNSFRLFAEKLPKEGTLIINSDIDDIEYFYKNAVCKNIITVGSNPLKSEYSACDITYNELGQAAYTLIHNNEKIGRISLGVPGLHNVYNSLAAIACALALEIPLENITQALLSYKGTHRRFERKGVLMPNNVTIIDDYAHHPDEIEATLKSAANYPHNSIWCIFQPHTYTRTKALMDEFAKALSLADNVILTDIYAARETDNLGISSEILRDKIAALGTKAYYFKTFEEVQEFVKKSCINNDLLITMGAGNVVEIGENLLK